VSDIRLFKYDFTQVIDNNKVISIAAKFQEIKLRGASRQQGWSLSKFRLPCSF